MLKNAFTALALASAMISANAGAVLINQGFDDVSTLPGSGWIITNAGTAGGITPPWFQGDQTNFTSKSGAASSYISSNYNNVPEGGTLASWLITPMFSLSENLIVSFWARGLNDPDYFDNFRFGFGDAAGTLSSFVLGSVVTAPQDGWTQYSVSIGGQGANSMGRFAIAYVGNGNDANVIGVDDLTVTVPEPSTWALVGISLLGLVAARRRALR